MDDGGLCVLTSLGGQGAKGGAKKDLGTMRSLDTQVMKKPGGAEREGKAPHHRTWAQQT